MTAGSIPSITTTHIGNMLFPSVFRAHLHTWCTIWGLSRERFKGIDWKKKKELLKEESTKSILYQKEFDRIYNHLIKSQGLNSGKCKITHSGKVCKWTKEVSEIHLELIHSPNTCRIRLWVKKII